MSNWKGFLGLVFITTCPLLLADTYKYEVSLNHLQTEADFTETDTTSFGATYYWHPVNTDDVPLAEAAFVNQASSLRVGFERRSVDYVFSPVLFSFPSPVVTIPLDQDTPVIGIPGGVFAISGPNYLPGPINSFYSSAIQPVGNAAGDDQDTLSIAGEYVAIKGWIAGLEFSRSSDDRSSGSNYFSSSYDVEVETVQLTVGKFIAPMTSVSFEYTDRSNQVSSSFQQHISVSVFPGIPPPLVESRSDADYSIKQYSILAKSLISQWGYFHKLQLEIGYDVLKNTFSNSFGNPPQTGMASTQSYAKRWRVGYALYPRNNIEIGLGFASVDPEFGGQETFDISAEWFVKPRLAIRVIHVSTSTNRSYEDSDGFGLGVTGRF